MSGKTEHYAELSPADKTTIQHLKDDEDGLDHRLAALEAAILATPEKALAVPMLKQQVDGIQDRTHGDVESIRGEISRLFTLTQWFIGLMFTIALGVFGLALNNLRRGERELQRRDDKEIAPKPA